jgi:dolichol-phosphate mannosyltransferase
MKILIVVPTYNERENISAFVPALLALPTQLEILVVDDSSPDGTGQVVQQMQQNQSRVHLLTRQKKEGLGRAYLAGFAWGLAQDFDIIVEMDADFSHRPEDLLEVLRRIPSADFVVGSRYCRGGRTVNWGLLRKLVSRGGSIYSRMILGYPLRDWTGGFNAWKADTLRKIGLERVQSNGYSFQIELKYRALKAGCHGVESPIVFADRRVGQSKMSLKIVLEAFWRVWKMRWQAGN